MPLVNAALAQSVFRLNEISQKGKIMKRLLPVTLTVLLLLATTLNTSVFAASYTYALDALELQVTIPSGYSVITRDTPASDPIFSALGTSKAAIVSQLETSNIYLNALSDTYNEEIVVTNTKNGLSNFSLLSDTVLNTFASALVSQYTVYGIDVSKYEIYQHSQAKFIKLYFTDTANNVHGLQYYTVYGGNAMNFTMRSYEGSLSSRQESAIKAVVDSIEYDHAPPISGSGEDAAAFLYTDTESGAVFTVPANWKQEEFTQDREFLDVKFVSTKEDGCAIIYASTDMWGQMSAFDKVGYTRSDLNNSAFTKSEMAEVYNTTADKISMVTYNGVQYFKGETSYSSDTYGMNISVTITQLVYIENGWMYMFQFGGTSTHKLYSDFESLLNSVQYPAVSDIAGVGSLGSASSDTDDLIPGVVVAIVLLLMVVALGAAFIITRKKDAEGNAQTSPTSLSNTPVPTPLSDPKPMISCKNCGQALPADSAFCHMCGTEIIKE